MGGFIYKITNIVNNKVYIGLTTTSIENRWNCHIRDSKKNPRHLYSSIRKYGIENFKIEKIDEINDFRKLGELERFYIEKYNSTNPNFGYNNTYGGESNQLDGNPRAKLTVSDVEDIRRMYDSKQITIKDAWNLYKNLISFSAFEKIWEGITWKSVLPEVYNDENKKWHNTKAKSLKGYNNGNAIYTDKEVIEIRNYYVNHTLKECYKKYGEKSKNIDSFRGMLNYSYMHLPVYKKNKKMWINNN